MQPCSRSIGQLVKEPSVETQTEIPEAVTRERPHRVVTNPWVACPVGVGVGW